MFDTGDQDARAPRENSGDGLSRAIIPPVIEWRDGAVYVLDQRQLPDRVQVIACDRYEVLVDAIRSLAIRGAPALGVAAGYAIALAAHGISATSTSAFLQQLDHAIDAVVATRPTAVNLSWAAAQMRTVARESAVHGIGGIPTALLERAHAIATDNGERHQRLSELGAELFEAGDRVLHHCNTGALATVDHGSALGVIHAAHRRVGVSVWVNETRPLLQGARLTTWELAQWGVPYTLITDGMAGDLMRRGMVNRVIVGADRIAANGDVANKIGTYSYAALARLHGVPFYVAAPFSTVDLNTLTGDTIPIEQRAPEEVRGFGAMRWAPADAPVYNPAFDVTPHAYVTSVITELGIAYPPYVESLARLVVAAPVPASR